MMSAILRCSLIVMLATACETPAAPALIDRESDREFDGGSRIQTRPLSPVQIENLALLAEVWGFAKYHHPGVAGGMVNWDYELFRAMPAVLEAGDRASATARISAWLAKLGDPEPCSPCAAQPADVHLSPPIEWIHDTERLGGELSNRLDLIHQRRSTSQFYVAQMPVVRNPDFAIEARYADMPFPDAGYRLLSLFRFWNIIQYWFPYRDVMEEDWPGVLREFIPRLMAASTANDYRLEMMLVTARVNDTHANLSHLFLRPPVGAYQAPVVVRFVEDRAVVTGFSHPSLGPATGLEVGDVIETLDGRTVESLVAEWRPYYGASNEPARLHNIARFLTRGESPSLAVTGTRDGVPFHLSLTRVPIGQLDPAAGGTHDLPGPAFRMLSDEVAYLKLSSVQQASSTDYIRMAEGAEVLVIDIRNYPNQFVVFTLGRHLVVAPSPFARFTRGDLANPGAFLWDEQPTALTPMAPRFDGAVVILIDEVTLSQAEYTTMAFRTAPGAIVVGSTTAGADGNVSGIPLPGGIDSRISGIGVFYPDRTPTQRIGIVPDLVVRPTIQGIREGRDEVLEAGVGHALGREFRLGG